MLNDKQMKLAKNVVTAQFDAYFDGYQTAPTEEEFYSVAESVRNAIPSTLKISDEEYEKILLELRQTIGVRIFGTATKNIFVKTNFGMIICLPRLITRPIKFSISWAIRARKNLLQGAG